MEWWQYDEIIDFLRDWVKKEGLCRFCDLGRTCEKSRRGRQECPSYMLLNEGDCFHVWIACFDDGVTFRPGYDSPNSYPWELEPPEADIPPGAPTSRLTDKKYQRKPRLLLATIEH